MKVKFLGRKQDFILNHPCLTRKYKVEEGELSMTPRDFKAILASGDNARLFKAAEAPTDVELDTDARAEIETQKKAKSAAEKAAAEKEAAEKEAAAKKAADAKAGTR